MRAASGPDLAPLKAAVRRFIEENDLSLRAFAKRAGLSSGAVSRLLSGDRKHPANETIEKIRAALGLPAPPERNDGLQGAPQPEPEEQIRAYAARADDLKLARMIGELEGVLRERRRRRER